MLDFYVLVFSDFYYCFALNYLLGVDRWLSRWGCFVFFVEMGPSTIPKSANSTIGVVNHNRSIFFIAHNFTSPSKLSLFFRWVLIPDDCRVGGKLNPILIFVLNPNLGTLNFFFLFLFFLLLIFYIFHIFFCILFVFIFYFFFKQKSLYFNITIKFVPVDILSLFLFHAENTIALIVLNNVCFVLSNCVYFIFYYRVVCRHHVFALNRKVSTFPALVIEEIIVLEPGRTGSEVLVPVLERGQDFPVHDWVLVENSAWRVYTG